MKKFDLDGIKRSIADKYNWPPPEEWTNFHFRELSKAIEETTGDRISGETLKRVFGKRKVSSENYQPQAFTLNALRKFSKNLQKKKFSTFTRNKKIAGCSILAILVIAILFFIDFKKNGHFTFSCDNPVDSYPYTATFKYDIKEIKDSVFCSFGNNEETFLPPGKNMINYFYSAPGIYDIYFYTRSGLLDSLKVVAWSKDWNAGTYPNSKPELFQLFKDQNFYRGENYFYASPDSLKEKNISWQPNWWTSFRYIYPFNKSLDNLIFETRVQNNASTGSLSCFDIDIKLSGDSGRVNFRFTQLKCSRYATFQVSEKKLDGEFNDLSAFSVDMSDWLEIKMTAQNNHIKIFLAGDLVFERDYNQPLGKLLGINYSFFGSGKIDFMELKDTDNNTFYKNGFNGHDPEK